MASSRFASEFGGQSLTTVKMSGITTKMLNAPKT